MSLGHQNSADDRLGVWREALTAVREELRSGPRIQKTPRGVALLIVLMVLALMSTFTAEFHYKSWVRLHVSANQRDEVIAHYHARSAMEIARFVINSRTVFENVLKGLAGGQLPKGLKNQEMWQFACDFANAFCSGEMKLFGLTFFDFKGMGGVGVEEGGFCKCRATSEEGRVGINRVDLGPDRQAVFKALYESLVQEQNLDLALGEVDRDTAEIALNIIDWADSDEQRSDLVSGSVINGVQAENLGDSSEVKNAKYDTLAEMQYVDGMTPALYCGLAEKVTPYAVGKLNVNQANLDTMFQLLCAFSTNALEVCYTPSVPVALPNGLLLQLRWMEAAMGCMDMCRTLRQGLGGKGFASAQQFFQFLERLPPSWGQRPVLDKNTLNGMLGVKSEMVRLETVGGSYGTFKSLTSVVDTKTGEYVYYREY